MYRLTEQLTHQILSLTGINFTRQTVIGFTELTLIPTKDSFRYIWINAKQICIYKVMLNDSLEVQFQYFDPLLEICPQENKHRNLEFLNKNQVEAVTSVDPEYGRGELVITVPSEAQHMIQEGKPLRVGIEFSLEKPQSGLQFVVPNVEGSLKDKAAHMFTYGFENSSRLWFPCIDIYNEVCTWRLEFTVDESLTAISCGDLVEVVYTTDMRRKTFYYSLNIPTSAPNIGLAVGAFEIYMDPYMNEITHFCLPQLLPVMKANSKYLHEAFEFYEEMLAMRYPYTCYKQVYVDEAYSDLRAYTTMSICSVNLLCSTRIIDQVYLMRNALVLCVAEQFFGCFISRNSWADAWLTGGISRYLMGLYVKKYFGFNEYKDWIHCELQEVIEYEEKYGGILLDPSGCISEPQHHNPNISSSQGNTKDTFYFSVKSPHSCSPRYIEMYYKKAHLIMRMLEVKLDNRQLMMQVLNKHLSLGLIASEHKGHPSGWGHMVISTATFIKTIYTVTGKDITVFCDQWVRIGGHAKFKMKFVFNRKRNIVEMTIEQNAIGELGIKRYVGPLVVWLQELDGTFKHTLQIEHQVSKKEIVCHSKSRRNKKKKIPLCTGEEVDMDLSHLDADSPVLWLRLDPDMTLLRAVEVEQPDNQWQYQLRHERDVTAQADAIAALDKLARIGAVTCEMRNTLNFIIENEQCYYKIRCRAAHCLTKVANAMVATWNGPPAMMQIFRKIFGSHTCPNIIKLHDYTNFQHYYLLKALPVAMAGLRTIQKQCQPEVLAFLLDLFKYSDNSKNQFSDNYYRASLVDALAESVSPTLLYHDPSTITSESLPEDIKKILSEVTRMLNLEKLLPCYKLTVTSSCLHAIRVLQKNGYLPPKSDIFKSYATYPIFIDVRLAAIDQLIDFLPNDGTQDELEFLLNLIETDPLPLVRFETIRRMSLNPPFQMGQSHTLDTEQLVDRLWFLMSSVQYCDSRIRCGAMDLYFSLYGRRRPACIPASNLDSHGQSSEKRSGSTSLNIASLAGIANLTSNSHSVSSNTYNMYNEASTILPTVSTRLPPTSESYNAVASDKVSEPFHPIQIKQEIEDPRPVNDIPEMDGMDTGSLDMDTEMVELCQPTEHHIPIRIKDEVDVFDEEIVHPPTPDGEVHQHMEDEPSVIRPDEFIGSSSGVINLESFQASILSDASLFGNPSINPPLTIDSNSNPDSNEPGIVEPNVNEPNSSTAMLTGDAAGIVAKHKLKKKKKDKKHKKHKKHKHEHKEKDKLEKFAEEENLSSGSSNPPSPSSLSLPSAPSTPITPDIPL